MAAIGFVGLGNMGGPMAANLIKAGHKLRVLRPVAARDRETRRGWRRGSTFRDRRGEGGRRRHHHASRWTPCPRHLSWPAGTDRIRATRLPSHRLLDHRRGDGPRSQRRCRSGWPRHARRSGLGGVGGAQARDAHFHGRRKRERVQTRRTDPILHGQGRDPRREGRATGRPRRFATT